MNHQDELTYLTQGYQSVAQMTIELAYELGYLTNPRYMLIAPFGDNSSAGLPFVIDPIPTDNGQYEFFSYDIQHIHTVAPEFQVLVYIQSPTPLSDEDQLQLLKEFACQFGPDSLIGQFLNHHMLAWLERNKDIPNIHYEYVRMKNAAYRLEDDIMEMERLYNDITY